MDSWKVIQCQVMLAHCGYVYNRRRARVASVYTSINASTTKHPAIGWRTTIRYLQSAIYLVEIVL